MPNLPILETARLQEIAGRTDEQFRLMAPYQVAEESRDLAKKLLQLRAPGPTAQAGPAPQRGRAVHHRVIEAPVPRRGVGGSFCRAKECGQSSKGQPGKLLCGPHWAKVPKGLADEFRSLCKPGKPTARRGELVSEILALFR